MPTKKELLKKRKTKTVWKDLNDNDILLFEKIGLKDKIEDSMKTRIRLQRPIIIDNINIGDDFYKRIQINEAMLYAIENVPKNCFSLPKIFKTDILKYFPNDNQALMMATRRKILKFSSEDIKFKIIDIFFDNINFNNFPLKKKKNYPFAYVLKPVKFTSENQTEGIFIFKFFLKIENMDKISFTGTCRVLSDHQKKIIALLENKDKELENKFFDKVIYKCFLKSKEIMQEEGLPFPEVEWILKEIKKYKKK